MLHQAMLSNISVDEGNSENWPLFVPFSQTASHKSIFVFLSVIHTLLGGWVNFENKHRFLKEQ